jgi:hypothetical protein
MNMDNLDEIATMKDAVTSFELNGKETKYLSAEKVMQIVYKTIQDAIDILSLGHVGEFKVLSERDHSKPSFRAQIDMLVEWHTELEDTMGWIDDNDLLGDQNTGDNDLNQ